MASSVPLIATFVAWSIVSRVELFFLFLKLYYILFKMLAFSRSSASVSLLFLKSTWHFDIPLKYIGVKKVMSDGSCIIPVTVLFRIFASRRYKLEALRGW